MIRAEFIVQAASAFESRWTMATLKRIDPELYEALQEQCELYYEATVHGNQADIKRQGEGLARGYAAAVVTMEQHGVEDDAYLIGEHNGVAIAISNQKAVHSRLLELGHRRVVILSPDEVAMLFTAVEQLKGIAAIKQLYPGAEVIDRYPEEPAKGDGQ